MEYPYFQRKPIKISENGNLTLDITGFIPRYEREWTDAPSFALTEEQVRSVLSKLEQESARIHTVSLQNSYEQAQNHRYTGVWKYVEWPLEVLEAVGRLQSVTKLTMHEATLNENEVRGLFARLKESKLLKKVDIGPSVTLDSEKTYALLIQFLSDHSNLQELRLSRSPPLTRRGKQKYIAMPLRALGQAIPSWQHLTKLDLYDLRNKKANDKALTSIGRGLERIQSLQELHLSFYQSGRTTSQGFTSLMQSIGRLQNIKSLDFSHSRMNGADASAMARAVRESKKPHQS